MRASTRHSSTVVSHGWLIKCLQTSNSYTWKDLKVCWEYVLKLPQTSCCSRQATLRCVLWLSLARKCFLIKWSANGKIYRMIHLCMSWSLLGRKTPRWLRTSTRLHNVTISSRKTRLIGWTVFALQHGLNYRLTGTSTPPSKSTQSTLNTTKVLMITWG